MRGVIGGRLERLNQMKGEEGYEILSKLLAHDPEEIGSFMASPVEIETEAVYEVDTYGSSMAAILYRAGTLGRRTDPCCDHTYKSRDGAVL